MLVAMEHLAANRLAENWINIGCGIMLLSLIYKVVAAHRSSASKVPGPWYTKYTEVVLLYHWIKGQRPSYVHALHEEYGPTVRIAPDYVDFAELDSVKTIYTAKETFLKSKFYTRITSFKEQSIFNTNSVEHHRKMRRLLAGPMSETSLKNVVDLVTYRVDLSIEKIKLEMKNQGFADVAKWWIFMATDIIGELTFGESFRMTEKEKKNDYARELERLAPLGALRSTFPMLTNISKVLPLPLVKQAAESSRNVRNYAIQSLQRYSSIVEKDPDSAPETLFKKLFKAEEDEKLPFEDIVLTSQAYIVAGSDTTANTLTFLTWAVCRSPDIRAKLVKELSSLSGGFTEKDLRELPYLNSVIQEGLRMYPAVATGLPRVVPSGGAEIGGYWLSEDTTVCSQAYSLHRNPSIYPNPNTFDPSRWDTATKEMKDSILTFGKGARVCLGLHLAMMELRLATARFFTEFPNATMSTMEGMSDADMSPKMYFLSIPSGKRCLIQAS